MATQLSHSHQDDRVIQSSLPSLTFSTSFHSSTYSNHRFKITFPTSWFLETCPKYFNTIISLICLKTTSSLNFSCWKITLFLTFQIEYTQALNAVLLILAISVLPLAFLINQMISLLQDRGFLFTFTAYSFQNSNPHCFSKTAIKKQMFHSLTISFTYSTNMSQWCLIHTIYL